MLTYSILKEKAISLPQCLLNPLVSTKKTNSQQKFYSLLSATGVFQPVFTAQKHIMQDIYQQLLLLGIDLYFELLL